MITDFNSENLNLCVIFDLQFRITYLFYAERFDVVYPDNTIARHYTSKSTCP